jgi:hypothetical protein
MFLYHYLLCYSFVCVDFLFVVNKFPFAFLVPLGPSQQDNVVLCLSLTSLLLNCLFP